MHNHTIILTDSEARMAWIALRLTSEIGTEMAGNPELLQRARERSEETFAKALALAYMGPLMAELAEKIRNIADPSRAQSDPEPAPGPRSFRVEGTGTKN